jgi:hypothetical protein
MGSSPVSRDLPRDEFNTEEEPEEISSPHSSTEALITADPVHEGVNSSHESLAAAFESLTPDHDGVVDSKGKYQPGFQVPNDAIGRSGGLRHPLGGPPLKSQKAVAAGSTLHSRLHQDPSQPGGIRLRDDLGSNEGLERHAEETKPWNRLQQVGARIATPVIRTALEPARLIKKALKSAPQGMPPPTPIESDFARRRAAMRSREQEQRRLEESDSDTDTLDSASESEPDEPSTSGGPGVTSI